MPQTLNAMFLESVAAHGDRPAFKARDHETYQPITYGALYELVRALGTGLLDLGIRPGDHVALFSDNRLEWIVSDLAVLGIGCADVPRGSDSTAEEFRYILAHSDATATLVENEALLKKLLSASGGQGPALPNLQALVVLDEAFAGSPDKRVHPFDAVLRRGRVLLERGHKGFDTYCKEVRPDDLATIIYTSGTTGEPKGVLLTHANFLHNVRVATPLLQVVPDDRFLSILPSWHAFERIAEYIALRAGASTAYTSPKTLADDLLLERPTVLVSVPRIWEGVYQKVLKKVREESPFKRAVFEQLLGASRRHAWARRVLEGRETCYEDSGALLTTLKRQTARATLLATTPLNLVAQRAFAAIRAKTGGCLRLAVSGGGALPRHIDEFFDTVGITILEGYGLTETSPVVSVRIPGREVLGTVGPPLPETEVKITDEKGRSLPRGTQGIIKVRGPQVMPGYYKDPKRTAQVIDPEGWFDTGDLGRLTLTGEIAITGRVKDTIVLLGGENVEPAPIEAKLTESPYVAQVMVVGQDQKSLAALLVPRLETLAEWAAGQGLAFKEPVDLLRREAVRELYKAEIRRLVGLETGFKPFERVARFRLLSEEFRVGEELTHTLKMKRNIIAKKYARLIREMYEE